MEVNNAGVSGVEVEGDVSILEEFIAQDVKLLEADGQVLLSHCTDL